MSMSTQTLDEAAKRLATAVLIDVIQIFNVSEPVTQGVNVVRNTVPAGPGILGLVQSTTLDGAIESATTTVYSVKVGKGTAIHAGQAVRVISCANEPDLNGKWLLLDKVSKNGLAMIRKCVASDFEAVQQQGKGNLA